MGRFQNRGHQANRSFGGRGNFKRGGGQGNRSFNDSDGDGKRSFGNSRGGGFQKRGRGFNNRGGANRSFNDSDGDRNRSFGNNRGGKGFFKKQQNTSFGNGNASKSFSNDTKKRKFDSDSDEDEIVEKPKSILKTPNLNISKPDKKKVKLSSNNDNSFQTKTPSTPHPVKQGKSAGLTPVKPKVHNFDDDDHESDEEVNGAVPSLEQMDFEDSEEDSEMESYEEMSGEDTDLEEDELLAGMGGAEDSLEEDEEEEEELESDKGVPVPKSLLAKATEDKPAPKQVKPSKVVEESDEDSDDEPVAKKQKETESKLSSAQIQVEKKRKLEIYQNSLFLATTPDQIAARKNISTVYPLLCGVWKLGKGLLFVFDSHKSRAKALQWFKTNQQPDLKSLQLVEAEKVSSLVDESPKSANPEKLHFSHFTDRVNKKHFQTLFPTAEAIDMKAQEAILTFKSADAAQKVLESVDHLKILGLPVFVEYYRQSK